MYIVMICLNAWRAAAFSYSLTVSMENASDNVSFHCTDKFLQILMNFFTIFNTHFVSFPLNITERRSGFP